MLRRLKAALFFARHQSWVNEPNWTKDDAAALSRFLDSETGSRFKGTLLNLVLRAESDAIARPSAELERQCGWAAGQKGLVAVISALADTDRFTPPEDGSDPLAS